PEAAFRLGRCFDRGDVLHPIRSGPARYDDTRGKSVEVRQRCSVHLIGYQRRVLDRLPGGNALDEIGRLVGNAGIGPIENDLDCLFLEADLVEEVLEPGAFPACTPHGAVSPFHAGNMRLEYSAPVAGAEVDRHHFGGRQAFEILESELSRAIGALAANNNLPSFGIDLWNVREMVANEKHVIWRNGGAEIFERGLVIRRAIAVLDQGLLARQLIEDRIAACPLRQSSRQIE